MLRKWFGTARYSYNEAVKLLASGEVKASWMSVKAVLLAGLPEWADEVPYQIKSLAIKDACDAVSSAKRKFLKTKKVCKVTFRTRKDRTQGVYIPKSAVKAGGIYIRLLGAMKFAEALPREWKDCRLTLHAGRYYLCVPYEHKVTRTENQGRVISLDPGVRTFMTYFHERGCGKLGLSAFNRIQRLCAHLDFLLSLSTKVGSITRRRMRKAADRIRNTITDLVDELHWKCIDWLTSNFDVILLPTFETAQMSRRTTRKIGRKSVRAMLTLSHYKFKIRLRQKAFERGKTVLDVNEAYTSKTVSWTGEIVRNLGGSKSIKSKKTGEVMDRDYNGARGILLRALRDHSQKGLDAVR